MAILGVFLYHAVHPFGQLDWHIKNTEYNIVIIAIIVLLDLWGMPFFFLIAGTCFALKRRTPREHIRERFKRLFIPFIFGVILFVPPMMYFEWIHKTSTGEIEGSFLEFVINRNAGLSPMWFGALGYHLWFLGFLFSFSVLALPFFIWMRKESRERLFSKIAKLSKVLVEF